MERNDRDKRHTTDGQEPTTPEGSTPTAEKDAKGMFNSYWVLSEEDRSSGWVRPYRDTYTHVGIRPKYPTRELTEEEKTNYDGQNWVAFEEYPVGSPENPEGKCRGRFWTSKELSSGCGVATKMGRKIAESYAKSPGMYNATYCVGCQDHLPVGKDGEFVWDDGSRVGT